MVITGADFYACMFVARLKKYQIWHPTHNESQGRKNEFDIILVSLKAVLSRRDLCTAWYQHNNHHRARMSSPALTDEPYSI